jgi:hypothetical protein
VSHSDNDTLPIPEFDHLPVGSLETRIRSLDQSGLEALIVHETKHANRVAVMNLLRHRLQALHAGAKPTAGGADPGTMPEVAPGPGTAAKASPQTSGPPTNPPSHGVPTNPAQPRG